METHRQFLPLRTAVRLLIVCCAVLWTSRVFAQDDEITGWVEGKLKAMTLREKVGQLLMVDVENTRFTPEMRRLFEEGRFGGVILFNRNLENAEQTRLLIHQLQNNAIVTTGVPLLISVDQEGGLVNRLGDVTSYGMMRHSARTLGKVYSYAPKKANRLISRVNGRIARMMRGLGFNMNMAPVLDLTDDEDSYIYKRSYGGDPELVSRVTASYASVMTRNGVIPTGKHFPNLSGTVQDSHKELPVLDRSMDELMKHEFIPFMNLKERLGAVMVGHVMVPSIDPDYPSSISRKVIDVLREKVGFKGVIITDDVKMKALADHFSVPEITLRAIYAGCDMIIMAWDKDKQLLAIRTLEHAVQKKRLSIRRINESVRRILELKYRYAR